MFPPIRSLTRLVSFGSETIILREQIGTSRFIPVQPDSVALGVDPPHVGRIKELYARSTDL